MEGQEEPSIQEAFSREEFARAFAENFNKLVSTGITPNQAAAAALLQTQESLYNIAKNEPIEETHIITVEEVNCLINDFLNSNNSEMVLNYLASNFFNENVLLESFTINNQSNCFCGNNSELESDDIDRYQDMIVDEVTTKIALSIECSPHLDQFLNITKLEQINQILNNIIQKNINTLEVSYNEYLYEFISNVASAKTPYTDQQFIILFIIILECPTISDPNFVAPLNELFKCFTNKPTTSSQLFQNWLICFANEEKYKLYLTLLSQLCNINIYCNDINEAKSVIKIISYFYEIKKSFPNIKISDFYIDSINQDYMTNRANQEREFDEWFHVVHGITKIHSNNHSPSLVSYPFILNPAIKAIILEMDAILQMRFEINNEVTQAIQLGSRYVRAYLILNIRREYIIPDTLSQMMGYEDSDFKKPLKVIFDGEDGVDAGGVRKEFYQIMMKQLLDPNFGMFKYFEESRLLWFNSNSLESSHEYELIGILLGIAIYNSIIVNLNMPMVIYKKLKNLPCTLTDLAELEPTIAKGLQQLLDYDGDDVQAVFGASFQITYELYGEVHTVYLKSCQSTSTSTSSDDVEEVTNDNREEYVTLYVHWVLDHSIAAQYQAFSKGFRKVCGGAALDLFEAQELELLVCGNQNLDFKELERGTKYEDGYTQNSLAIHYFWAAVHQFTDVEKKLFLSFVSGSDRAPIDGLGDMGFVISRNGADDIRLPSAHTCFNHLLLPEYSSFEILQKKLTYAIHQSEGFGLR